ncbi:hypothetical protein BGZ49_005598 [Haplosporangium sp. Z 27]|nr:hypothetical protein BGZ49_005598 [Haplosporangium sp. Z 27]
MTASCIMGVFEDKERAFEVATQGQLREFEQDEKRKDRQERSRQIKDLGSWEKKFDAVTKLYDESLDKVEFTMCPSQSRFKVLKVKLDNAFRDRSQERCLFGKV